MYLLSSFLDNMDEVYMFECVCESLERGKELGSWFNQHILETDVELYYTINWCWKIENNDKGKEKERERDKERGKERNQQKRISFSTNLSH